jgi:hypothetical protein
MTTHVCKPHEIVPEGLRKYLRWDHRHDATVARIMREFNLELPRDRELIRQLVFVYVAQGEAMNPVMPAFAFARRRDIEIETGLLLAGNLIVDIPKDSTPKRKHERMIVEFVQRLVAEVRAGRMPDDAVMYGWPGGRKPDNAADYAAIDRWAETRMSIAVRIDPRNDGLVRIDSDTAMQLGLMKKQ